MFPNLSQHVVNKEAKAGLTKNMQFSFPTFEQLACLLNLSFLGKFIFAWSIYLCLVDLSSLTNLSRHCFKTWCGDKYTTTGNLQFSAKLSKLAMQMICHRTSWRICQNPSRHSLQTNQQSNVYLDLDLDLDLDHAMG